MTKQEILARMCRGAVIRARTVWRGDEPFAAYTLSREPVTPEQLHELLTGRFVASVIVEPDVQYRVTQAGRIRARVQLVT